jgi:Skp family chaperone for outer membrane proteins
MIMIRTVPAHFNTACTTGLKRIEPEILFWGSALSMKKSTFISALTLCALLTLSGCDRPPEPKTNSAGLVAVVDMAKLQQESGFKKARDEQLKKLQDQLEPIFTSMQQGMQNALSKEAEAMGKFPTPAQQAKFEQTRAMYAQLIEEKYTQIQTQMQQRDMELQVQFRQKVHNAIADAAAERGMSVVIETGPWMVAASDECNVTAPALSKIKAQGISFEGPLSSITGSPGIPGTGTAPGNGVPGATGSYSAPGTYAPAGPSYPGAPAPKPANPSPAVPQGTGPLLPGAPVPAQPAPAPQPSAPVAPAAPASPAPATQPK